MTGYGTGHAGGVASDMTGVLREYVSRLPSRHSRVGGNPPAPFVIPAALYVISRPHHAVPVALSRHVPRPITPYPRPITSFPRPHHAVPGPITSFRRPYSSFPRRRESPGLRPTTHSWEYRGPRKTT